jgi:hypothetical protein
MPARCRSSTTCPFGPARSRRRDRPDFDPRERQRLRFELCRLSESGRLSRRRLPRSVIRKERASDAKVQAAQGFGASAWAAGTEPTRTEVALLIHRRRDVRDCATRRAAPGKALKIFSGFSLTNATERASWRRDRFSSAGIEKRFSAATQNRAKRIRPIRIRDFRDFRAFPFERTQGGDLHRVNFFSTMQGPDAIEKRNTHALRRRQIRRHDRAASNDAAH